MHTLCVYQVCPDVGHHVDKPLVDYWNILYYLLHTC